MLRQANNSPDVKGYIRSYQMQCIPELCIAISYGALPPCTVLINLRHECLGFIRPENELPISVHDEDSNAFTVHLNFQVHLT